MIKYMIESVFSKARIINVVGFEIQARTPVQQLPQGYTTPAPPPPPGHAHHPNPEGEVPVMGSSRKHTYIILTPLNPTFI